MAKLKVTWMSDSSAVESLHINGPQKKEDSYLGHVIRIENEWFFIEKGVEKPHGPYDSSMQVRRAALVITGGEYV